MESVASSPHKIRRYAEQVVTLAEEHNFPQWLGWGLYHLGSSLMASEQEEEGLQLLTKGLAIYRSTGAIVGTAHALTLLAQGYAKLGRSEEGLNTVAEAEHIIEMSDERYSEADLLRVKGDLLKVRGNTAEAEQTYRQALAIAKCQSARIYELRASTGLARLRRDLGERIEARKLLTPIYDWFPRTLETMDLEAAKVLLQDLNKSV